VSVGYRASDLFAYSVFVKQNMGLIVWVLALVITEKFLGEVTKSRTLYI